MYARVSAGYNDNVKIAMTWENCKCEARYYSCVSGPRNQHDKV